MATDQANPRSRAEAIASDNRRKRKPRGRPFAKGNTVGRCFQKGQSGNPGGRPKNLGEMREAFRDLTEAARLRLAQNLDDKDGRVANAAAHEILDRGWGQPSQLVDVELPTVVRLLVERDE